MQKPTTSLNISILSLFWGNSLAIYEKYLPYTKKENPNQTDSEKNQITSKLGIKKRIIKTLEKKFKIILKIYINQITDQKKYL